MFCFGFCLVSLGVKELTGLLSSPPKSSGASFIIIYQQCWIQSFHWPQLISISHTDVTKKLEGKNEDLTP